MCVRGGGGGGGGLLVYINTTIAYNMYRLRVSPLSTST